MFALCSVVQSNMSERSIAPGVENQEVQSPPQVSQAQAVPQPAIPMGHAPWMAPMGMPGGQAPMMNPYMAPMMPMFPGFGYPMFNPFMMYPGAMPRPRAMPRPEVQPPLPPEGGQGSTYRIQKYPNRKNILG